MQLHSGDLGLTGSNVRAMRFPIDTMLVDGVIASPQAMEDKWAIYLEGGRLLFVRSWLRQVIATADVRVEGGEAVIGPVRGIHRRRARSMSPRRFSKQERRWMCARGRGQAVQTQSPVHVHVFLDHGADPNAVEHRGFTALHRAAEMGQVDVVKVLLAAGARVDVEAEGARSRLP